MRFTAAAPVNPLRVVGTVDLEARANVDPNTPAKCMIMAYGGGIMRPVGFGQLVIDLVGLEIPASVPLLADHNNTTASVLGSGIPRVHAGKLFIDGGLVRSAPATGPVLALAAAGHQWAASVGVDVRQSECIRAGVKIEVNGQVFTADEDGLIIVRSGVLREVSIVPLGADKTASATIAASANGVQEAMQLGAERERSRISAIDSIMAGLMGHPNANSIRAAALAGTIDQTTLTKECLTMLRASRPLATTVGRSDESTPISDFKDVASAALLLAMGRSDVAEASYNEHTCDRASRMDKGLHGIVRAWAEVSGHLRTNDSSTQRLRAAFSSSDIPNILSGVADKVLLAEYRALPDTWRSFCAVRSTTDLRDQQLLRTVLNGVLEQVGPNGEIKHANLGEERMPASIGTFAKMFSIDRRSMINDDLGALATVPASLARMAKRSLSDLIWTRIMAASYFTAGNKNYLEGASTPLSIDALQSLVTKMRQQKDATGHNLDIAPAVLAVPPELEWTARQIISSAELRDTTADSKAGTANPLAGLNLGMEVEPRLSNTTIPGNSGKAWYLFGAPVDAPVVVLFLNGQDSPTTETAEADFDTLGMQMRVVFDYGAAEGDFRAAAKAKGEV